MPVQEFSVLDPRLNSGQVPMSVRARLLADQLIQQKAADTSTPVYHTAAGIAKLAAGALGGLMEGHDLRQEEAAQSQARQDQAALAMALIKARGGGLGAASAPPAPSAISGAPNSSSAPSSYAARVAQIESGGNPSQGNPNSSAQGLYQFTVGTWGSLMKSRPDLGLTAGGRNDPAQQQAAFGALTQQNAAALADEGLPATPANLYLAHFAGAGGAASLLKAPPNAPVVTILGSQAVKANPALGSMTAGDLVNSMGVKMQGVDPASVPGAAPAGQPAPAPQASAPQPSAPQSAQSASPPPAAGQPAPSPQAGAPGPAADATDPGIRAAILQAFQEDQAKQQDGAPSPQGVQVASNDPGFVPPPSAPAAIGPGGASQEDADRATWSAPISGTPYPGPGSAAAPPASPAAPPGGNWPPANPPLPPPGIQSLSQGSDQPAPGSVRDDLMQAMAEHSAPPAADQGTLAPPGHAPMDDPGSAQSFAKTGMGMGNSNPGLLAAVLGGGSPPPPSAGGLPPSPQGASSPPAASNPGMLASLLGGQTPPPPAPPAGNDLQALYARVAANPRTSPQALQQMTQLMMPPAPEKMQPGEGLAVRSPDGSYHQAYQQAPKPLVVPPNNAVVQPGVAGAQYTASPAPHFAPIPNSATAMNDANGQQVPLSGVGTPVTFKAGGMELQGRAPLNPDGSSGQTQALIPGTAAPVSGSPAPAGQAAPGPLDGVKPIMQQAGALQTEQAVNQQSALDQAKGAQDYVNAAAKAGMEARQHVAELQQLKQLAAQSPSGMDAYVHQLVSKYHLGVTNAGDRIQEANALRDFMGTQLRPEGSGALKNQEMDKLSATMGSLDMSPAASVRSIQRMSNIMERAGALGDIASDPAYPTAQAKQARMQQIGSVWNQADAAIAQGAPSQAVLQRMQQMGVPTVGF